MSLHDSCAAKLPAIASNANNNSSLTAYNGGTILDPLLTTLNRAYLALDAASTLGTGQITAYKAAPITVSTPPRTV